VTFDDPEINIPAQEKPSDRAFFFVEEQKGLNLTAKTIASAAREAMERLEVYVSPQNILTFKHGPQWRNDTIERSGKVSRKVSEFQRSAVETSFSMNDLKAAKFEAIEKLKVTFRDGLLDSMVQKLFGTIVEATSDQPATTLDVNGDIRPGMIDALKSIKIGLTENLQPILPTISLPGDLRAKFFEKAKEVEENDPEFMARYERLKHRKWLEALIDHFENKLKFQLSDDERSTIGDGLQQIREAHDSLLLREGCLSDQGKLDPE